VKLAQTRLVALHVVVMAKDTFLQKMEQPVLVNTETSNEEFSKQYTGELLG